MLSDSPDETRVLRRAAPYLRGHGAMLTLTTLATIGAAGSRILGFALVGVITDAVLAEDRARLLQAVGGLAVLVLAGFALTWLSGYLVVRVGEAVVRDLREEAFERVASAPLRFLEAHRGGELVRRLTGEIAALSQFVGQTLPALANSAFLVVLTVVMLLGYSWPLTLVLVAAATIGSTPVVVGFLHRAPRAFAERAAAEAQVSARLSESIPAHDQLRALGARERRLHQLGGDNDRLLGARILEVRATLWLLALDLVGGLAVVVLLGSAALATAAGWISVGGAVVFLLSARRAFGSVEQLVGQLGDLRAARTHLARVIDLTDATAPATSPTPEPRAVGENGSAATLVATDVGYAYDPGTAVLHGVDLTVRSGERVALVGATGSGKTTLGKLLAGLYRPDSGDVRLGGVPLSRWDPAALRREVVFVPQEVTLVSGTVADNLMMVPVDLEPDPRRTMAAAAASLGLDGWLESLPEGLDTPVGDHGTRISAGERQLVALVRAALLDPAVLVLDEATADVDPGTAASVEDALSRAARGRAVVVIAHRPDTVGRADRSVEMMGGVVRH